MLSHHIPQYSSFSILKKHKSYLNLSKGLCKRMSESRGEKLNIELSSDVAAGAGVNGDLETI